MHECFDCDGLLCLSSTTHFSSHACAPPRWTDLPFIPGPPNFFEILASSYGPAGPGPYGPEPLIIWKNILGQICSRIIFEMHTAPEAFSKYAPGAVCIQIMLLEHIWLRIFFQIFNGHMVLDHTVQEQLVLYHKSRPKSQKSLLSSQLAKITFGSHIILQPILNW